MTNVSSAIAMDGHFNALPGGIPEIMPGNDHPLAIRVASAPLHLSDCAAAVAAAPTKNHVIMHMTR